MKIVSEKIIDTVLDQASAWLKELTDYLIQNGKSLSQKVKQDYLPLLDDMVKNLTGEIKGLAFGEEVDILTLDTIVSLSKKYMVRDGNEVVATRIREDGYTLVYLAYSKDRQLLPTGENKYIIIKAASLSKEVEDLFTESELVILK